jgi:hypothetical protein
MLWYLAERGAEFEKLSDRNIASAKGRFATEYAIGRVVAFSHLLQKSS